MSIRSSRKISFLAVLLIYIAASAVGIAVYCATELSMWLSLLIADTAATVFVFIFSLIFRNSSVYDPYWSVQPIVILAALMIANGVNPARLLVFLTVAVWGVRLTANWAYTFKSLSHQDWRYTMLSEKCGAFYPIVNFVGIHYVPTLVVYLATLPAAYVMVSDVNMNLPCALALLQSLSAAILQGAADIQMHKFRRSALGGFIRTGLWRHSRHPNYLGEILMWWGIAFASLSLLGLEPYTFTGALANTVLFLTVSIPMADGRQSRKLGFAEYKSGTRMLLPIKRHGGK